MTVKQANKNPANQDQTKKLTQLIGKGQFLRVIETCKKKLKKTPKDLDLYNMQGIALFRLGRFDEAISVVKKGLEIRPSGALHNTLAQIYNYVDAELAFEHQRKAVELSPNGEHMTNLALMEMKSGNIDRSVVIAKSCVIKHPKFSKGWYTLCQTLIKSGRHHECLDYIDEITHDRSKQAQMKAEALIALNQHDQAKAIVDGLAASRIDDKRKDFCYQSYKNLGLPEKAKEYLTQCSFSDKGIETHLKVGEGLLDLDSITLNKVKQIKTSVFKRRQISFAVATAHKKAGRRAEWMQWCHNAHDFRTPSHYYNEEKTLALFDEAIANLEKVEVPQSGSDSETPIFIIGMPRSGTTLTESIIGAHSQAFACGESTVLGLSLEDSSEGAIPESAHETMFSAFNNLDEKGSEVYKAAAERYIKTMRRFNSDVKHLVDKLPHNFIFAALIPKIFPKAKMIHIRRNPIANLMSIYEQDFSAFHKYSDSLEALSRYYKKYQEYMEAMTAHIPEGYMYGLQYEDLVTDTETKVREILDYIGLPFEQQCLEFNKQKRTVKTASREQVVKGIYTSSLKPWEGLEDELSPLLEAFPEWVK